MSLENRDLSGINDEEASNNITEGENRWSGLLYHHSRDLKFVSPGIVRQAEVGLFGALDPENLWLAAQTGFPPLFMSVGDTEDAIHKTEYPYQFGKISGRVGGQSIYRDKGEIENRPLFSYTDMPKGGVFMDYHNWMIIGNSGYKNYKITRHEKKLVLKPSFTKADWLRKAKNDPTSVMLVVPQLDLSAADQVSVRNKSTQQRLQEMGFQNVQVVRMTIPRY